MSLSLLSTRTSSYNRRYKAALIDSGKRHECMLYVYLASTLTFSTLDWKPSMLSQLDVFKTNCSLVDYIFWTSTYQCSDVAESLIFSLLYFLFYFNFIILSFKNIFFNNSMSSSLCLTNSVKFFFSASMHSWMLYSRFRISNVFIHGTALSRAQQGVVVP